MKKLLGIALIAGLLITGCGSSDTKKEAGKDKLVVLTNSGYPPYEELDKEGNLYGFDIDVMNQAAEIAGYEIEIKDVDFDAIIPSIKTGKADIAIAGITPSKERKKSVDFSDVYYSGEDSQNYLLYKEASGIKTQDDLAGKTIGCQVGTVQFEAATYFQDNVGSKVD
ncbi:MAG: transporter substrate-binding domain-containing protein, partial [Longicatena sp.]